MQTEKKQEGIVIRDGNVPYLVIARTDEKGIVRMYCEPDRSFSCIHSKFAWTLPNVQEMAQRIYGGLREAREVVP